MVRIVTFLAQMFNKFELPLNENDFKKDETSIMSINQSRINIHTDKETGRTL